MQARLGFAFASLCLFFAARAASEAWNWRALETTILLIVCGLPLAALLLAEGALRRHAPVALKRLVTLGGLAVALALLVSGGTSPSSNWALGGYVIASLLGTAALLLARDRTLLSQQENAGVRALFYAGLVLTALSVSDFLPSAPVGLSGLGAALLAFLLAADQALGMRRVWGEIAVMTLGAAAVTACLFGPLGFTTAPEPIRLGAVLLALLLATRAVVGGRRRAASTSDSDLAEALARADTSSLDRFLDGLIEQPLLAGLRLVEDGVLADYDAPALGGMMTTRQVWTRMDLGDAGDRTTLRARDELADLMDRTEATHAMMICADPLRIAILTLPDLGFAPEAQGHLAIFGKLASLAAENSR